jgi:hypothetical protein
MLKRLKSLLTALSLTVALAIPVAAPVAVYAQTSGPNDLANRAACGADLNVDPNAVCSADDAGATDKVNDIVKLVINIFSIIVGFVSVIMIIVGGLKYITSGGDSGNITGAKNTILYAIIGLVVVALAQIVVKFVLAKTVAAGS